ncbi:LacI family DNA-binding transcriptional regulator [Candidimonas sp. SYP-B2681]|uniref:LacI family DNA-binding transcriptional regulator n=1 Tax=Candidimonas sp. SYP-B2681 TaxID=2497686 RepID=UPI000F87F84A|nr:LacI family DNA-binding transcriptional regulator [Candidimonas sp. SYP-B2681]RTZ39128.1 LacI family DNA-binding transcriptional regulator [Candidimonas sp. SYP-B2681]
MPLNKPKPRGRTTLRSLAEQLGIHVSTVSRVLNGTEAEARSAASPEVIERIKRLAEELNYRPNRQAIGLKTRKTRLLGVILPRLTDLVVAMIYEGIDAAAKDNQYLTFVGVTLDMPERQIQLGEAALDQNVEGLIIGDARLDNVSFLDEIARRNIPIVLVNRRAGSYCSVTCNDRKGGRLVAEHLVELGHRDICVMAGEPYASTGHDRTAGFLERCAELGVAISPDWIVHSGFDTKSGRALGEQIFSRSKRPTAVFAVNDFLAIGLMGALRDQGIQVGRDVAVVGFNDTPIAAELPIGLSTIRSPMHQMGYRSVEVLLDMIAGRSTAPELLEPTLCVRESSNPNVRVYTGL